ncbi:Mco32 protein [Saccharomycopsis crataegensis]|uniref:Mco32 protein n=1 Tax=Saccharomycopsis crataegensis TaxID=43959 RepID=A0AAV5QTW7_9ASCO|nr:Mco32 protein [Saccharomycopsis crataegensis]
MSSDLIFHKIYGNNRAMPLLFRSLVLPKHFYKNYCYKSLSLDPRHHVIFKSANPPTKLQFQETEPIGDHNTDNMDKLASDNKRLINLNEMRSFLECQIPNLLQNSFEDGRLSDHVILRVCPHTHPLLPIIKNKYPYLIALKALRKLLTSFIINPKVRLHISSIHVEKPSIQIDCTRFDDNKELENQLESELLDKFSFDGSESVIKSINHSHRYSLFPWTYKIIVKWRSCTEDCSHLLESETHAGDYSDTTVMKTEAENSGLYRAVKIDEKFLRDSNLNNFNQTLDTLFINDNNSSFDCKEFERVLSGVFIFELNLSNDKVLVHNIEDIEIIERKIEERDLNSLLGMT